MIKKLKELVNNSYSFQNIVAQRTIDGLKEFFKDGDQDLSIYIADFLIEKTKNNNNYYIRASTTAALGKFLSADIKNSNLDNTKICCKKMNHQVFDCLSKLLRDERRRIKINACNSFADIDANISDLDIRLTNSIKLLMDIAEHDLDGFVRSSAERSLNVVREWIKELVSNSTKIDIKLREKEKFCYNYCSVA